MTTQQIMRDLEELIKQEEKVGRKAVFDIVMKIKAAEMRELGLLKSLWNKFISRLLFK